MIAERAYWLAWSQIPGIGPILVKRLQQHFGTLAAAWGADHPELMAVEGFGAQMLQVVMWERVQIEPEAFLEKHEKANPCFWTPADADYPRLLREIPNPPSVLYCRGQVDLREHEGTTPTIALVGTRRPSEYGRKWTRKLTTALVKHGFTIVSGLADGIDTEAHTSCLEAGGRTLAILGTGVDVVYPWRNRALCDRILEQGAVLSEYPAGTKPDRAHFPQRNRIIAGLSRAIVVTEAPEKSGALITAYVANEYNRDVYVVPGSLDNEQSIGCLGLISKGAQVILKESHLLEMLQVMPQLRLVEPLFDEGQRSNLIQDLEPELQQVITVITTDPVSFDAIVQHTNLPAATISSALLQLELLGLVTQLPGMRYQRC